MHSRAFPTGVLSLGAAIDPGFKWRRWGIIDPLGFIMVCIPQGWDHWVLQSSTHSRACQNHGWLHGHSTGHPHTWTGSQGARAGRGVWELHPKHTQLSCPQPPGGAAHVPLPHTQKKTTQKTNPKSCPPLGASWGCCSEEECGGEGWCGSSPQGGFNTFFSHTGCARQAEPTPKPLSLLLCQYSPGATC